jgi:hypothetical protein
MEQYDEVSIVVVKNKSVDTFQLLHVFSSTEQENLNFEITTVFLIVVCTSVP